MASNSTVLPDEDGDFQIGLKSQTQQMIQLTLEDTI